MVNRLVLSNPVMVWIGLTKYFLFYHLWHWPLLSFLRVMQGGVLPPRSAALAVGLAAILAYLTYIIVEKKNSAAPAGRAGSHWPDAECWPLSVSGAWRFRETKGVPSRTINQLNAHDFSVGAGLSELVNENDCGMTADERQGITSCVSDKRNTPVYALLGDLKAAALFPGLVRELKANGRWMLIGGNGPYGSLVPVISSAKVYQSFQTMTSAASDAIVRNPSIRVVVLTTGIRQLFQTDMLLKHLSESREFNIALDGLDRMIAKLHASGKKVVLTVDNPALADPHECASRTTQYHFVNWFFQKPRNSDCSISINDNKKRTKIYRDLLNQLSAKWGSGIVIYDPINVLCIQEENVCPSKRDGHSLYSYSDHISDYANGLIARELIPLVEGVGI